MLKREGFTLVEVMVAVLIVSVVIAALLHIRGDANLKLLWLKDTIKEVQYNSLLLGNSEKYGFAKSKISLHELVADFDIDDDLRRELKAIKVNIAYHKQKSIETPAGNVLEIGDTTISSKTFANKVLRVRWQ